jgi:hypothetical protein
LSQSTAFGTDCQFSQRRTGFFADEFQLVNRANISAFEQAEFEVRPQFSLSPSSHFNMTGGTDISTSAAADAGVRISL